MGGLNRAHQNLLPKTPGILLIHVSVFSFNKTFSLSTKPVKAQRWHKKDFEFEVLAVVFFEVKRK